MFYEIDLRSCKDGNSIETIYSEEDHDEAMECFNKWYEEHTEFNLKDLGEEGIEELVDGTDKIFADIYYTNEPHGLGKWNKEK